MAATGCGQHQTLTLTLTLALTLMLALNVCRIQFHMDTAVEGISLLSSQVQYATKGDTHKTETFDLILGADGRNSMVREAMQAANGRMTVDINVEDVEYSSVCGLQPQGTFHICGLQKAQYFDYASHFVQLAGSALPLRIAC